MVKDQMIALDMVIRQSVSTKAITIADTLLIVYDVEPSILRDFLWEAISEETKIQIRKDHDISVFPTLK